MKTASFRLLQNDAVIGELFYSNDDIGSYGTWNGKIKQDNLELKKHSRDSVILENAFQPLDIIIAGSQLGFIYQTESKKNFFDRFTYHKMHFNQLDYCIYPIGFGKEGMKAPVYEGNKQVAQINKASVVYNDLHHFDIFLKNEEKLTMAVICCMYFYMMGCFDPTTTLTQGKKTIINTDRNKRLLSYYHSGFIVNLE